MPKLAPMLYIIVTFFRQLWYESHGPCVGVKKKRREAGLIQMPWVEEKHSAFASGPPGGTDIQKVLLIMINKKLLDRVSFQYNDHRNFT